jgi:DNA-binding MarR family transcriptional regulator
MAQHPKAYHVARLWIELTRQLQRAAAPEAQAHFGTRASDLLLRSAIYVGTVEGRPLTVAKLATYVGIPRPTVVRRLRALERRGLVVRIDGAWRTPILLVERRRSQDFGTMVRLIAETHAKFKKN